MVTKCHTCFYKPVAFSCRYILVSMTFATTRHERVKSFFDFLFYLKTVTNWILFFHVFLASIPIQDNFKTLITYFLQYHWMKSETIWAFWNDIVVYGSNHYKVILANCKKSQILATFLKIHEKELLRRYFLKILPRFWDQLFCGTPPNGCFCV